VIWPEEFAPQAIRDVESAIDWLADNGGPEVARRMALATVEAARRVVQRPLAGHTRPELLPAPFRFRAVRGFPYLLVYDVSRTPARVLRVLHMARDLPPLLADLRDVPEH
jgi:plasmid stabilization system protein ParE